MNTLPDEDRTPGRDALTRAFMVRLSGNFPWTLDAMRRMPDDWQARMADLLNEYELTCQHHSHPQPEQPTP